MDELMICQCSSPEHLMLVSTIDDEDYKNEVYIRIHLNKLPFFKRFQYAFKYIFGYQCCYGAFDEFIFDKTELKTKINKL